MSNQVKIFITLSISLTCLFAFFVTPYMMVAAISFFIMCFGLLIKSESIYWHIRSMLTAIFLDTSLVLILQLERNAIQTAASFEKNYLQQSHIFFSSIAFALYFPMLYLGFKVALGNKALLPYHILLGKITFFCRTIGFLLMFSMLKL